jgi:hypothetical protein
VAQELVAKSLTLLADGSYELISPDSTASGNWTASTTYNAAILILEPGTERGIAYNILELGNSSLHIQFQQNGLVIEEQYLSTD